MEKLVLGKKKSVNVLKVEIAGKTYSVPLAGSLTLKELEAIKSDDNIGSNFFGKYIPQEIISDLTLDDFKALNDTWKKASQDASGVDLGE